MAEPQTRFKLRSRRRLLEVMEFKGFTSGYQLAKAAGLTASSVNHLVHGRRSTCSPRTARLMSEALGYRPDDLFVTEMSTVPVDPAPHRVA